MALVAQHADDIRGERFVEQLAHGAAARHEGPAFLAYTIGFPKRL